MLTSLRATLCVAAGAAASASSTSSSNNIHGRLNFAATFGPSVTPFRIDVDPDFVEQTRRRAALTRLSVELEDDAEGAAAEGAAADDGPPVAFAARLKEYWANEFDWFAVQDELNEQLSQYTTTVTICGPDDDGEPAHDPDENPDERGHHADPDCAYDAPVPLHFIHHRSPRADAIPLLFVHGWPGSAYEVAPLIRHLTHPPPPPPPSSSSSSSSSGHPPPRRYYPAFHVVAPSIPGFAFSPAARRPGLGYAEAARAFDALMRRRLGYARYAVQGGDAGAIVARLQAALFPRAVVAGHVNFWIAQPEAGDVERYHHHHHNHRRGRRGDGGGDGHDGNGSGRDDDDDGDNGRSHGHDHDGNEHSTEPTDADADADAALESVHGYMTRLWGYGYVHQTQPLRLAHALADSPVGCAMWMYDGMAMGVWGDPRDVSTPRRVAAWTMMHYVQGPYAALRIYKEGALAGAFNTTHFKDLPYIHQPMAVSQFPKDLGYRTDKQPLRWLRRTGNVRARYVHAQGGHFPAWETPELLAGDLRAFFGDPELSGTAEFQLQDQQRRQQQQQQRTTAGDGGVAASDQPRDEL